MQRTNAEVAKILRISEDALEFIQMIDEMPIEDRREFRAILESQSSFDQFTELPRNLYFDYKTQTWI